LAPLQVHNQLARNPISAAFELKRKVAVPSTDFGSTKPAVGKGLLATNAVEKRGFFKLEIFWLTQIAAENQT
jgi:hypothetical protein